MATVISRTLSRAAVSLVLAVPLCAGFGATDEVSPVVQRAEAAYHEARLAYQADTNNPTGAWTLAKATFELAETPVPNHRREELSLEGIEACRCARVTHPHLPAVHYYLGLNLGQLARVRPLSALRLVRQMEAAFLKARELQPGLRYAGPDRSLGLLYREAPGWPTSVGSKTKARRHLLAAVELWPDYPENRLILAESGLSWREPELVLPQMEALQKLFPSARSRWTGPDWEADWSDWNRRLSNLVQAAKSLAKPN